MELRWFYTGRLPATVVQWCDKKGFSKEPTRTDIYLDLDNSDLGVKIRKKEEKKFFEIKYRLSSESFQAEKRQISGIIEAWKKASTPIKSEDTEPLKEVKAPRIAVRKIRRNRKFVVDTITRKVEPTKARVDQGLIVEFTDLSVVKGKGFGSLYWTLCFDALGDNQKEMLHLGVPNIMADCPLRKPQKVNSYSYPAFIRMVQH